MTDTLPVDPLPHQGFVLSRLPEWLRHATAEQRARLRHLAVDAEAARQAFKQAAHSLPVLQDFALQRLHSALAPAFSGPVDFQQAVLRWVDPAGKQPTLQRTLLEAALFNFHQRDTYPGAYGEGSGLFAGVTATGEVDLTRPLTLRPEAFASRCRALDLGGAFQRQISEHVTTQLPGREREITSTPPFAWRVFHAQRKAFMAAAGEARLQGKLGEEGEALLAHLRLTTGPVTPIASQAQRLALFDFPLSGLLVFTPQPSVSHTRRIVAYIPGDPQGSVSEYADARAFAVTLATRLQAPAFLTLLASFVPLARRPAFVQRVNTALAPDGWLAPHLSWAPTPISGDPFVEHYRAWAQQTLAEAATVAVPTAQVDHRDTFDRYAQWVEVGEQLGTSLALLVGSALPGINLIADAIVLSQSLYSVYQGVHAWRRGENHAALEHLFGAVENAGFFGLGKRPEVSAPTLDFARQLVPVVAADGQVRLWRPDLEDFRALQSPPAGLEPDGNGVYRHHDNAWVRIDGRYHQVGSALTATTAQVLHPSGGLAPLLQGNGAGAWRAPHERVAEWDGVRLIRRFDPRYEALPEQTLVDAQQLAGISDAQLRLAHLDASPMPPLLADLLARRLAAQALDLAVAALNGTRRLDRLPLPLVEALRGIPGWPAELALEYRAGNADVVFGPNDSALRVRLDQAELADGTWAARLIAQLSGQALDALLGPETSLIPAAPAHENLAQRWAAAIEAQRMALVSRIAEPETPADVPRQTLRRQFPGLPAPCVEALMRGIAQRQRQALAAGHMPPALAEQAADALRQLRVLRACDALATGASSPDRERLVCGLLPGLGGWAAGVRLELRREVFNGALLQAIGDPAGHGGIIVRSGGHYQAYDAQGLELSPRGGLEEAIYATLPASARAAAAPGIENAATLRGALLEQALSDQDALRPLLGLARGNRRFFRPPSRRNGAIGYELSGRGRLPATLPENPDPYRQSLRALFPEVSEAELTELRAELGQDEAATTALVRLNTEFARLRLELANWVRQAPNGPVETAHEHEAENRQAVADEFVRLWQRRETTFGFGGLGYGLTLRSLPVTTLPTLTVRFAHVQRIVLQDMGLARLSDTFLTSFPNLRWLDLSMNRLVELPALERVPGLQRLSLDYTGPRQLSEVVSAAMPIAGTLRQLDLAGTDLTMSAADFQSLRQFPDLRMLDLEGNLITLDQQTASGFDHLHQLEELSLSGNPLDRAPVVAHLRQLTLLDLGATNLTEFPPGLLDLMNNVPMRLRDINLSDNALEHLPDLAETRFVQLTREHYNNVESQYYGIGINLNANPLSPEARAMLRRADITFFVELPASPGSDAAGGAGDEDAWLLDCPPPLAELIRAERMEHEATPFYQLLSRVVGTADHRAAPLETRQRTWALVETWLRPAEHALPGLEELRQRLFALAQDTMGTCADGVSLTLDDMEFEVQAWRIVASSPTAGDGPLRELLAFQRRLWRRALVDDRARRIVRAREARYDVLATGSADSAPPLDPADDLDDALLGEGIDEVEVRFYLAQQLQRSLDLPPTRQMHYSTRVSLSTLARIEAEVRAADIAQAFATWVAHRPGFRTYLEHAHAQAFEPLRAPWDEAASYLFSLSTEPSAMDAPWPATLNGLREVLTDVAWPPRQQVAPRLNEQHVRIAYEWIGQQRQRSADALALQLTRQLLGLASPASPTTSS
ncbi:DUF6543 domain-containing protein [Pseudomonas sp. RIT-PI-S]|uniref:dermonecrotic toxin domain-containing protein n=1 Tax=Pseudomonas sp. RIT-PI-S TaxID=3035295 RepID=UPI0021DA493D|nr:DUF6543 domain-containing protein [Pseudomonas sp. RIT-PI-S]